MSFLQALSLIQRAHSCSLSIISVYCAVSFPFRFVSLFLFRVLSLVPSNYSASSPLLRSLVIAESVSFEMITVTLVYLGLHFYKVDVESENESRKYEFFRIESRPPWMRENDYQDLVKAIREDYKVLEQEFLSTSKKTDAATKWDRSPESIKRMCLCIHTSHIEYALE